MKFLTSFVLLGCLWLTACGDSSTSSKVEPPKAAKEASSPDSSPKSAQGKLQVVKLWVGPAEINAEIAHTMLQIQTGMMWRTNMEESEGMIFVFSAPFQASFWMRNTLLPLSCAYVDADGKVLEIHDMKPKDETPITANSSNVQYVLETKQGWFQRNGVEVGAVIKSSQGTLQQTFFRRR